jgi:hypothetical protein
LELIGRSSDSLELSQAVVLSALLFRWCKNDARIRKAKPTAALVAFLPPIGLPYYLFKSRPGLKAVRSLGKAFMIMLLFMILLELGALLGTWIT